MSAVTKQEIVEAFESAANGGGVDFYDYAQRLNKHGIAPPDGWVLVKDKPVCWAITGSGKFDLIEGGKTLEFSSESLGYWIGRGYDAIPLYATAPEEMEVRSER